MKRLMIAALAASTIAVASPALAQTVNFDGTRAVECSITGYNGTVHFGTLDRNGASSPQSTGNVTVFCNQPYKATIESTNGYLKLQTSNSANNSNSETDFTSHANPMFTAGLNYGLDIPGIGHGLGSQFLTASTPVTTPTIPATNISGSTTYSTVANSKPLLGGTYSDTVTITLATQGV